MPRQDRGLCGSRRRTGRVALLTICVSLLLPARGVQAQTSGAEGPVQTVREESLAEGVKTVIEDVQALALAPLNMDRSDWLKAGGAAAVVGGLFAADKPIRDFVQSHASASGKNVSDSIGAVGSTTTLLGVNAGVIAIGLANQAYGGGSWIKEAGLVSLEAEVFAVAAVAALKGVTGRARPEANLGATHFRPFSGLNSSMPSAHAAASFAVASVFADRFDPAIGWTAYTLAAAVSVSRIYSDKHFTTDVVLGGLIGWGMGKFLSRRHGADPEDWQVQPMVLPSGTGAGLMVGKRF